MLQEFEIIFTPLGTAATKIAIEAVAKRASLENMVEMSGDLVGELFEKTKLVIRIRNFMVTYDESL